MNWSKITEWIKIVCLVVITGSLLNISMKFGDIVQQLSNIVGGFANQ